MMILERKLFAKRDYKGLSDAEKDILKQKRSEIAKELNSNRSKIKKIHGQWLSEAEKIAADDTRKYVMYGDSDKSKSLKSIENNLESRKSRANKLLRDKFDKAIKNAQELSEKAKKNIKTLSKNNNNLKNLPADIIDNTVKKSTRKSLGKKVLIPIGIGTGVIGTGIAVKKHNDKKKFNSAKNDVLKRNK